MCDNARINDRLLYDNDYSAILLNDSTDGNLRMLICSGWQKPLRIDVEVWLNDLWCVACRYYPKYCPNCGRKIVEYQNKKEN